ncbi:uncharacterized protein PHACADRAFT_28352 [Phanerochaete carnosa HHB-10118-sp]|uniref:Replication factor A protein 3 n=1 Tax=Phanerochaete carnosa (strain HHB-10118-sp) TaxID=650164 RepID=K5W8N1_PHACS|nr:uncharacterized protein PHACADRAFT_28352 [Phanerochaete carnosa HHB-10118-sp]EKM55304.1 hypothetical protein PHACADRAFT_28352 [Phanerochaete carnosa HHB-10118-sp]
MSDQLSPRVNSARLPDYPNQIVRVTGKVLKLNDSTNEVILQASDGGEVKVKFVTAPSITSSFIEVVGNATAPDILKGHAVIDLGDDFDLAIADFVVERWHNPKFKALTGL